MNSFIEELLSDAFVSLLSTKNARFLSEPGIAPIKVRRTS